ncbi:MAG: fibronectin type III domain-containing protein [Spirochaetaceae bacterium]|nr:fibronectin type III domain-containing protein [Spirochaetaceae bacterium]
MAAPAAPGGLAAVPGHESLVLSWADPGDDSITGYEARLRGGGGSWSGWTALAGSGAATVRHRLTMLTNGVAYDVQLRARNAAGAGAASVAVNAKPLAGICERTPAVRAAIVAKIDAAAGCAGVTAEHLAGMGGTLDLRHLALATLRFDDFAGLSALTALHLQGNRLSALPARLFADLGALTTLRLDDNELTALPAGAYRGLDALTTLNLSGNRLSAWPADGFAALGALTTLRLDDNELTALPAGAFAGLDGLTALRLDGNPGAPFTLTLSLLQEGADRFRVWVAEGVPFAVRVDFSAAGGTPPTGTFTVAAGGVYSDLVTVTADTPDTEPVVTLGTAPATPPGFAGLQVASRAPPAPPPLPALPAAPAGVAATAGDGTITVTWTDPDDASISGYEVRRREQNAGAWGNWADIDGSGAATARHRLTGLTNGTTYEVQLRARNAAGAGAESAIVQATPRAGICGRTAAVQVFILANVPGVTDCADVTAAHLAAINPSPGPAFGVSLRVGDLDGLTALTKVAFTGLGVRSLPAGLFADLGAVAGLSLP